jgi:hypothetical protein
MQKITLQLADNGIVKSIYDDNINGAGEAYESTVVYEFDSVENRIKFIEELCIDVGLELGNSRSGNKILIHQGWGPDYDPSQDEAQARIKELEGQLARLKPNNG